MKRPLRAALVPPHAHVLELAPAVLDPALRFGRHENPLRDVDGDPAGGVDAIPVAGGERALADEAAAAYHDASAAMPHMWYKDGMARVRISTTVDEHLLATARRTRSELADSALIDEALRALLARNRAVEIDAAYAAYDRVGLDVDDEWGDLASFRRAAAGTS